MSKANRGTGDSVSLFLLQKKWSGKMKRKGRTTKYDTVIKPKLEEIKKWSQSGATGKQIASNLGIAESTLYKYKDEHQELASAIE